MIDKLLNTEKWNPIPFYCQRIILLVLLLVVFAFCTKNDDEDLMVECSSCVTYHLTNKWMASFVNTGSRHVSINDGHIHLNNEKLTYKRFYKGIWHSNDGGLAAARFASQQKDACAIGIS